MDIISADIIRSILHSDCDDVFRYLGVHVIDETQYAIRVCIPDALRVEVLDKATQQVVGALRAWKNTHFHHGVFQGPVITGYMLRVTYDDTTIDVEDPYRFPVSINPQDLYLFAEGTHERAYDFLGAHLITLGGVDGCRFAVWAPNAKRISVVGNFNFWDGRRHMMRKHIPSGVWEIFIPHVEVNDTYKFEIKDQNSNLLPHKADPFGFSAEVPPQQASVVARQDTYEWQDASWQDIRSQRTKINSPVSIYEVHLGSWKRVPEEGNRYLTYRELAHDLVPYVKYMGFTHIQLMPVSEFPFDGSWGYQPIGLFAPTSRFGSVDDFKYFVDQCHQHEIALLIDWVPGHFPTDIHGLGLFDGTPLYEHADARQGFHPDWNTYIYNFGRSEVKSFLMASALFWMDKYHIDGLRVDAVASMLYLDYSREDGEWLPNKYGGRENLEAIDFLRLVNERAYKNYPDCMMIAEESTAWPGVSQPTNMGGLGFGFKWNMGWMNDSLAYISEDPIYRQYHHNNMTFSLYYAFSENFVLPLSHDEVVHGKGSLLSRMPGDSWQKFANLRAYFAFMWAHPGKKLLFMGGEFGQGREWNHSESLCWHQTNICQHKGVQLLVKSLNETYLHHGAFFHNDSDESGFEWIEADDNDNSVFAFLRKSASTGRKLLVVSNLTPVVRHNYRVGCNEAGSYRELINTDDTYFGGTNLRNSDAIHTQRLPWQHRDHSIEIDLPALSTLIFELI